MPSQYARRDVSFRHGVLSISVSATDRHKRSVDHVCVQIEKQVRHKCLPDLNDHFSKLPKGPDYRTKGPHRFCQTVNGVVFTVELSLSTHAECTKSQGYFQRIQQRIASKDVALA